MTHIASWSGIADFNFQRLTNQLPCNHCGLSSIDLSAPILVGGIDGENSSVALHHIHTVLSLARGRQMKITIEWE